MHTNMEYVQTSKVFDIQIVNDLTPLLNLEMLVFGVSHMPGMLRVIMAKASICLFPAFTSRSNSEHRIEDETGAKWTSLVI